MNSNLNSFFFNSSVLCESNQQFAVERKILNKTYEIEFMYR